MTLAELIRMVESKKRVQEQKAKEQAIFDYTLADLVGRSIARIHSSSNHYPGIAEVYPSLFDAEEMAEQAQAKKDELSVLRFKQFAQAHNNKFKEGGKI